MAFWAHGRGAGSWPQLPCSLTHLALAVLFLHQLVLAPALSRPPPLLPPTAVPSRGGRRGFITSRFGRAPAVNRSPSFGPPSLDPCSRALAFYHIPKTGGTSVEAAGWGRAASQWSAIPDPVVTDRLRCWQQHVPIDQLPPHNPFSGKDVFCVVRNPLARAVSEFKYVQKYLNSSLRCSAEALNAYLLQSAAALERGKLSRDPMLCHLMPQARHVWAPDGRKLCHIVLRFESLSEDYGELMRSASCRRPLPDSWAMQGCQGPGVSQLDASTLDALRRVYAEDFALFGYSAEVSAVQEAVGSRFRFSP